MGVTCPLQDGPHLRRGTAGVVGGAEGHILPAQPPLNHRGEARPGLSPGRGVFGGSGGRGRGHHTRLSTSHACVCPFRGAGRWNRCVWGRHRDVLSLWPDVCSQRNRDRVRSLGQQEWVGGGRGAAHFSGFRSL